jgi:hypothetical protein
VLGNVGGAAYCLVLELTEVSFEDNPVTSHRRNFAPTLVQQRRREEKQNKCKTSYFACRWNCPFEC